MNTSFRAFAAAPVVLLVFCAGQALAEKLVVKVTGVPAGASVTCTIGNGKTFNSTAKADAKGNVTFEFTAREAPENGSAKWAAKAEYKDSKGVTQSKSTTKWSASTTTFTAEIGF